MELSQPASWVKKPFAGYMINTSFSDENANALHGLIEEIDRAFQGSVFCMPKESLHITLLDWIAPLVDYEGRDKDKLFAQVRADYDRAMSEILSSVKPITVHFNELEVSPTTIFMIGHDDGEFQAIREQFLDSVELLPNTKKPPRIIHSSLARFTKPIDLSLVRSFIARQEVDLTQKVTDFRLIRTAIEPMLEFEIIKRYRLD